MVDVAVKRLLLLARGLCQGVAQHRHVTFLQDVGVLDTVCPEM